MARSFDAFNDRINLLWLSRTHPLQSAPFPHDFCLVFTTSCCVSFASTAPQYHYPAIAPIIKEVCKEHGVDYIHLDTFAEALYAHVAHLKNMGEQVSARGPFPCSM